MVHGAAACMNYMHLADRDREASHLALVEEFEGIFTYILWTPAKSGGLRKIHIAFERFRHQLTQN